MYNIFHKNMKQHNCFQIRYQHIIMISEGSCDTETGLMVAEMSALSSQEYF